ncbi:hypothetical protein [Luteolibacter marinus]|uniref:hypothetical protein n=1 Tax=Luteolibacter marinus TaxID=2776705 RepID=UPI00186933D4|nr:hypothetical protein [Luteolibacter marinus]
MPPPASILPARGALLVAAALGGVTDAAPTGTNLGFESNLNGWENAGVSIKNSKAYAGSRCLELKAGHIQQTISGLQAGAPHVLALAYRNNTGQDYNLSHARLLIDGNTIAEIHNGILSDYIDREGFEFIPATSSAVLRIESLGPGPEGFLIDAIRITTGSLAPPPQHDWSSLTVMNDARGGRQLANGGFESPVADPSTSQDITGVAGNPHICDFALPGWLVTRENVDVIGTTAAPPEGTHVLDTNGNGPGAIAQTITGLQPGAVHTLSFLCARHASWGTGDMTGEVRVNGRLVESVVRSYAQNWNAGYALREIPVLASATGTLTVEIRSTVTDRGGCIAYDDIRLKQGGDGFLAWSVFHGVEPLINADDDRDGLANGLEFLFGSDPQLAGSLPLLAQGQLRIPLSGLALSQGYDVDLMTSRSLSGWQPATAPGSGLSLISDSSAPGVDGERRYAVDPGETRLFWKHVLVPP